MPDDRQRYLVAFDADPSALWAAAVADLAPEVRETLSDAARAGAAATFDALQSSPLADDLDLEKLGVAAGLSVAAVVGVVVGVVREAAPSASPEDFRDAVDHALALVVGAGLTVRDRTVADAVRRN